MNSRINGSLMRYSWYIYPSGNQTWRAGKSLIYREFPIAMFDFRRVLAGLVLVINSYGNGYNGDINDWLTMSVYISLRDFASCYTYIKSGTC
jgi:hypothetical protein